MLRSRAVGLVLVGLVVAGCSSSPADAPRAESTAPVVQLGAPGQENRTLSSDDIATITTPPHSESDVDFVRGMLHHHAQALEMTGLVPERTTSRDVRRLAERMEVSQTDEIEQLEAWLAERGETVTDLRQPHAHAGAGMPGMLTEEEMAELEAARGEDFERLFLQYMIRHHEGALVMVADLFAVEGGQEPAVNQIAQHVDSDQRIEIARMTTMLADLSTS